MMFNPLGINFIPGNFNNVESFCDDLEKQLTAITPRSVTLRWAEVQEDLNQLTQAFNEYKLQNPLPQTAAATAKTSKASKFKSFAKKVVKSSSQTKSEVPIDTRFDKVEEQLSRVQNCIHLSFDAHKNAINAAVGSKLDAAVTHCQQQLSDPADPLNSITLHMMHVIMQNNPEFDQNLLDAITMVLKFCYPKSTHEYLRKAQAIYEYIQGAVRNEFTGLAYFTEQIKTSPRYWGFGRLPYDTERSYVTPIFEIVAKGLADNEDTFTKLFKGEALEGTEIATQSHAISALIDQNVPSTAMNSKLAPHVKEHYLKIFSKIEKTISTLKPALNLALNNPVAKLAAKAVLPILLKAIDNLIPVETFANRVSESQEKVLNLRQRQLNNLLEMDLLNSPNKLDEYINDNFSLAAGALGSHVTNKEWIDFAKSALIQSVKFIVKNNMTIDVLLPLIELGEAYVKWQKNSFDENVDAFEQRLEFFGKVEEFIGKIFTVSPKIIKALENEQTGLGKRSLSFAKLLVPAAPSLAQNTAFMRVETIQAMFNMAMSQ